MVEHAESQFRAVVVPPEPEQGRPGLEGFHLAETPLSGKKLAVKAHDGRVVGLAVAVLLDATLIRSILVPASMALLGRVNWYLPVALHRILPRLHVEGPRTKPALPPA